VFEYKGERKETNSRLPTPVELELSV